MTAHDLRRWLIDRATAREPLPGPWLLLQSQGIARAITGDVACSECKAQAPRGTLDGTGRCGDCRP